MSLTSRSILCSAIWAVIAMAAWRSPDMPALTAIGLNAKLTVYWIEVIAMAPLYHFYFMRQFGTAGDAGATA
jgi:hypothetical protein